MAAPKKKRSWAATLWLVASLVFAGMFALDYWIRSDAAPLYSFAYGFFSGGAMLLAAKARRRTSA